MGVVVNAPCSLKIIDDIDIDLFFRLDRGNNTINMAAAKRIVVCGGGGFLGSRICKSAVARGWDVTSIKFVSFRAFHVVSMAQ